LMFIEVGGECSMKKSSRSHGRIPYFKIENDIDMFEMMIG
jgi:hypothetical protein